MAAEQGDGDAQGLLGSMYEEGEGLSQDYVAAYMWETLSIMSDSSPSRKYFADQSRGFRHELAAKMTKAQIEDGQRRADNWTPNARGTN